MIQVDEILEFTRAYTSSNKVQEESDIYDDLDLAGDDFHDFIEHFAARYEVDLTAYLWYFHADEEGLNLGSWFFKPPYARVKRIPVTPKMLTNFANSRKWTVKYPEHHLPERRYDLLFNQIVSVIMLLVLAILLLYKYWG
ncbi:DUF1493 family protein [Pontibacter chinhatensis]|uniref:DUF1493 family protein n=1 Tax=Pontibacter chinhatensis TaxID=1436961 RepID=A0A1I2Y3M1_9BACT|nr:DUF1493 family protein [Pontibacter chinhatensis]SFH20273.1 Protein of unknown function [Pontibacter chinhatensis]